jgi:hypothetical protein
MENRNPPWPVRQGSEGGLVRFRQGIVRRVGGRGIDSAPGVMQGEQNGFFLFGPLGGV